MVKITKLQSKPWVSAATNTSVIDTDVTIVIPCYKHSKFVLEAVNSCLNQTHLPKQIIVLLMDPESWKLEKELNALGSVRSICSGKKLLPSARNFGFGLATTTYVIPLDADDILEPNFIQETRKIDADVVYVGSKSFGAQEGWWPPTMEEEIDWDKQTTLRRNPIVCTARIKRTAWESIGGYSDTLTSFEDMELWIRLHENGFIFKKCKTTWLNYRKHHDTSMLKEVVKDVERHRKLYEEVVDLHPFFYGHIPRLIHYVWLGEGPKPSHIIEAWKKLLPKDWVIKEWNESNLDLKSNASLKMLREAYAARKFGIAVDPIRAQVLYDYGGFWLDTDCVLNRDITPFCQYDFVAGYESQCWLNVGLVGARQGSMIMKDVLEYYKTLDFTNLIFCNHEIFVKRVGTGPHVLTRSIQKLTNFIPDGMPQTIEISGKRWRFEPACVFTLNDEPNGACNYAVHLYNGSWTDQAGQWADVVRQEYNKWKVKNDITTWEG